MSDALNIIKYIFTKQLNLMFNEFLIAPNVTIGWVIVVITIFSILISNIINLAKSSPHTRLSEKGTDIYGNDYRKSKITGKSRITLEGNRFNVNGWKVPKRYGR